MATIVNDRDVLMQATVPRYTSGSASKGLVLSASSSVFNVPVSGSATPALITLKANLIGITGTVSFSTEPSTTLAVDGNSATLAYSDLAANSVSISATIVDAGSTYTHTLTISKLKALGALGTQNVVNLASQVIGYLASSSVSGLGALSALNTLNLGSGYVSGTIDARYQVSYLGALAYASSLAADQIGAGTLAAGVIYAGSISAAQIIAGYMSADRVNGGTITGSSISINGGQFYVNGSSGAVSAGNFIGSCSSFGNLANPSAPAINASAMSASSAPAIKATGGSGAEAIFGYNSSGSSTSHGMRGQGRVYASWTPPTGVSGGGSTSVSTSTIASGIVGCTAGYDFYADGGGTNYGPFTGAHDVLIGLSDTIDLGDIVVDVECVARSGMSNTIFRVQRSSTPYQRGAVGVLSVFSGMLADHVPAAFMLPRELRTSDDGPSFTVDAVDVISPVYDALKDLYLRGAANALGEGQLNVVAEGGDISIGDLIVTSSTSGKGMRQADDIVRSYTVARAREACNFSSSGEVRTIACIYLCG